MSLANKINRLKTGKARRTVSAGVCVDVSLVLYHHCFRNEWNAACATTVAIAGIADDGAVAIDTAACDADDDGGSGGGDGGKSGVLPFDIIFKSLRIIYRYCMISFQFFIYGHVMNLSQLLLHKFAKFYLYLSKT